jgi:hypothetical protein
MDDFLGLLELRIHGFFDSSIIGKGCPVIQTSNIPMV